MLTVLAACTAVPKGGGDRREAAIAGWKLALQRGDYRRAAGFLDQSTDSGEVAAQMLIALAEIDAAHDRLEATLKARFGDAAYVPDTVERVDMAGTVDVALGLRAGDVPTIQRRGKWFIALPQRPPAALRAGRQFVEHAQRQVAFRNKLTKIARSAETFDAFYTQARPLLWTQP